LQLRLEYLAQKLIMKKKKKNFSGDAFDRFYGLDPLLELCEGKTLLDIGSCEGLTSYEFARNGVSLIHGYELDSEGVIFSRRLFKDIRSVDSNFEIANMAISGKEFVNSYKKWLLPKYDIVLYLGVYHHLIKQTSVDIANSLVEELAILCGEYFAVRTGKIDWFEDIILASGFEVFHAAPKKRVGALKIYRKLG